MAYTQFPQVVVNGRLGDISSGGMCFLSDYLFAEKSTIILVTYPPPKDTHTPKPIIEIQGTVTYCFHSNMSFKAGISISRFIRGESLFREWAPP